MLSVLASRQEAARMLPSAARSPTANALKRKSAPARTAAVVMQPATVLPMISAALVKNALAPAVRRQLPARRSMRVAASTRVVPKLSRAAVAALRRLKPLSAKAAAIAARAVPVIRVVPAESPVAMAIRLAADTSDK